MSMFRSSRPQNIYIHRFSSENEAPSYVWSHGPPSEPLSILMKLGTDIENWLIDIAVKQLAGIRASFGAADLETLIFPGFRAKRSTMLILKSWAPIWNSFNPNETWNRNWRMTSLHGSFDGLLAQKLVFGQQTAIHWYSLIFEQKKASCLVWSIGPPSKSLSIKMKLGTNIKI